MHRGLTQLCWSVRCRHVRHRRYVGPEDVKRAALLHELGHRLNVELLPQLLRQRELDGHRALYLYLYDVWVELYGARFANAQVEVEKGRTLPPPLRWRRGYNYRSAWKWALALGAEERAAKLRVLAGRSIEVPGQE